MNKLEALYEFAEECDIDVISGSFSPTKKAACLHLQPQKLIILDKPSIESPGEEGALLAEELGHFETGALYFLSATYNAPAARSNRIKCEGRAKAWAYKKYCPPGEIETAFKTEGPYGVQAVADYCSVTVDFLYSAIAYHRSCGVAFAFDGDNYE